ncbi:fumarylacetoacetate hydrolase family protein [Fontivita pretiosa]|jgi:2-dehydro-3-deoxy-D-arabinonate dehydratase|uniref:fumarylacetoacetate hydrolase family protein n=1 Tax=Fontivita pretiosa TaxID=2989684 RepID=UPI003D162996
MKLYRTSSGVIVERDDAFYRLENADWDALLNRDDLLATLQSQTDRLAPLRGSSLDQTALLAPIVSQEVWAAGVTYYRSRDARMEESQAAGGGSFYDRVYTADRPELFFKALAHRVAAPGKPVRIRRDSNWNVPEPELTLVITSSGKIVGYTIGNDMSSRDIEGQNPLYLPQAKVYDGCCALGPGILVCESPLEPDTGIHLRILRNNDVAFEGHTTLRELKRKPRELVDYLYRESSFPAGCFLLTGTGIIPPPTFTLEVADLIEIVIDPIGTLVNPVSIAT